MTDRLLVEVDAGVLTATLHRPDKRNAIDTPMMIALQQTLERADLDADVRVVAIRGAGKDWCAGLDLAELLESVNATAEENRRSALQFGQLFLTMRRMPKPVVAVVHGRVLAGGCGLATACDMILAPESAKFGYPEVQRGFVPAIVMTMLRRSVGEKAAFELASTGRIITATEARDLGLISRVFGDGELESGVEQILGTLTGVPASSLALTKQQFYQLDGLSFETGIRLGAAVNAISRTTPAFSAAIAEFLDRPKKS